MNPTLLKDLILAGHRVACKDIDGQRKVFFHINGSGKFEGTGYGISINLCLDDGLTSNSLNEETIKDNFTGEYKIVTPLPQLPQVGDTVELLEICRELPLFNKWLSDRKDMVGKKHTVDRIDESGDIYLGDFGFTSRQVSKCEPEKAQSIQSEEQFGDTIVFNGRTYKAI